MAANEPMIKLEPGGQAPVLSYNVPDPTTYTGRNFIELQIPAEHFEPVVDFPRRRPVPKPSFVAWESREGGVPAGLQSNATAAGYDVVTAQGVYRLASDEQAGLAADPGTTPLRPLDAGTVRALARAGRSPDVYRSMSGSLGYRPASTSTPADELILPSRGDERGPTAAGLRGSVLRQVRITYPAMGDALSGPAGGVTFETTGWSQLTVDGEPTVPFEQVYVQVGADPFAAATPGTPDDFSTWTFLATVTASGPVTITASVGPANHARTDQVSVPVTLSGGPLPEQDPPKLQVTAPPENPPLTPSAAVTVTGTATDASSGVAAVEVRVGESAYVAATPKAPGDWSTWAASVSLTEPGRYTITVHGTDNAGNHGYATRPVRVTSEPVRAPKQVQLLLVEVYRLSSFLGAYGAGRVVKTFSLLPGERTKISVKTYTRSQQTRTEASSILDSFTTESATDFEKATEDEQTSKENYIESFEYSVSGEAQANWGWGSAKISAGVGGGTNAAREDFAKNIATATQKHAAKASAKRDVQVNTSYEVREEKGEETAIERELQNINVSRTLNFVFRQMNQEFISLLHLVDVRIGYARVDLDDGGPWQIYREVSLSQLDSLLEHVIVPAERTNVYNAIVHQLENIFDHADNRHDFTEAKQLADGDGRSVAWLRIKKDYVSQYADPTTGTTISVPGIIMAVKNSVMRTEGVIVDALLGQGDALDAYSHGLQEQAVKEKELANAITQEELERLALARAVIEQKDKEAAAIYAQIHPRCPDGGAVVTVSAGGDRDAAAAVDGDRP